MQLLYNIAAILIVIMIIPMFMVRAVREKGFVERIRQSLGFLPKHALDKTARKNCIWVHAASVGEIVAASPLIKEFHKELKAKKFLPQADNEQMINSLKGTNCKVGYLVNFGGEKIFFKRFINTNKEHR